MWKCKNCSERIDENFDNCWKCGFSREGAPAAEGFTPEANGHVDELTSRRATSRARKGKSPSLPASSGWAFWYISGAAILGFFLFFHVMPEPLTIFPKQSPTFANTFVDLDELLRLYNAGNFADQIAMRQTFLFQQLRAKGLIVNKERSEK